jgi:CRP-like cAMP-binding protein
MPPDIDPKQNRLLGTLPQKEYDYLLPHLEPVALELKHILYEPNEPISHLYFLTNSVGSLLAVLSDGAMMEVGTVGNEGFVGLPVFLGANQVSSLALIQVAGDGVKLKTETFRREVVPESQLFSLMQRYALALFSQTSQNVACNQFHSIEERFCRWMLMTHDRIGSDQFVLTQEFIAQMLGVRRASVSVVASVMQQAGFIQYKRGKMTILNREGLESTSCECYQTIKAEFQRLIGGNTGL